MLSKNYLKEKLDNGSQILGTWSIVSSPVLVDVIASTGVDFIIIDAEHGAFSYETAQILVSVCQSHQVSPVMRVGEINESLILRAMDIGMHGIQLPNVQTAQEARRLVKYSKYPPVGIRGFSPYTKAGLYDVNNAKTMSEIANENTLIIVNIEDEIGLKNLKNIAKVDGVDVIFIGLFDLSKALGMPGNVGHNTVLKRLDKAIKIVHDCHKKIGSIASTREMLEILKDKELDYVTYSVDTGVVKGAYQKIVKEFSR